MAVNVCVITLAVVAVVVVSPSPVMMYDDVENERICPPMCQCTNDVELKELSVHCNGGQRVFAELLRTLPANVTHFTFKIENVQNGTQPDPPREMIDLFQPELGRFQQLKGLIIQPADETLRYQSPLYKQSDAINGVWPLCQLEQLEELRLNSIWDRQLFRSFDRGDIDCLKSLRILDLSYAHVFLAETMEWLFQSLAGKPLEVLLLRDVQMVPNNQILKTLHFKELFPPPLAASPLRELDLSENGLNAIGPGLISTFPNLTRLILSDNFLYSGKLEQSTLSTTFEALIHPQLKYFDVSGQHYGGNYENDPAKPFSCKISNELAGRKNNLSAACDLVRCILNDVDHVVPCSVIPPKGIIDWTCNNFIEVPLGPHLEEVHTYISSTQSEWIPHSLQLDPGRYCINPDSSLKVLDITGMLGFHLVDLDEIYITGLEDLRVLKANHVQATFRTNSIFGSFPNLQELHLKNNRVVMHQDTNGTLFSQNTKLQLLDISDNSITHVPKLEFAHLSLLKKLDLSNNLITTVNFTLPVANSTDLKELKLNNNNISVISPGFLAGLDEYQDLLSLDLNGNILACSCNELYLLEWMQQTDVNLLNKETYQCQKDDGNVHLIDSINVEEFYQQCNPPISTIILGVCLSVFVVAVLCILITVMYRKRWQIRYRLYHLTSKGYNHPTDDYRYDGFVSYHSDDKDWVHHALREEIEGKRNLKLFIYMRDLLGGGALADRIHDAMKECRRTMFVLSPNFLASEFCLYELEIARCKLMAEGVDVVILVFLRDLPMMGVPGSLTSLLQMTDHTLTWTEDEDGKKLFWDKLEESLLSPPVMSIRQARHTTL